MSMTRGVVVAAAIVALSWSCASAQTASQSRPAETAPRIGWQETFDSVDGWKKLEYRGEMADLKEMKAVGGVGVFVTFPAPLESRREAKWSDGLPLVDCFSNVGKEYPQGVDLDTYHYFVAKIDEKNCPCSIMINGVGLPVMYTTGLRVVDLRHFKYDSLRGKQPIKLRMQFLNTGGTLKLDELRLVRDLTAEEKKGLIPPGYVLPPEGLKPNSTQGLYEVMKRVDRPRRDEWGPQTRYSAFGDPFPGQGLRFRDTATGAMIWRITGVTSGATVISDSVHSVFNANGSHMLVLGGRGPMLYEFATGTWTPCPYAGISRFSPKDPDVIWCIEQTRQPAGMRFHKVNFRQGLDEVVAQIEFDRSKYPSPVTELGFASGTDAVAVGLRETPCCFVVDPTKPPAERVRMITLPMRLKGMGLSPDGKRLFFNRCYWYESWEMDLESGKTRLAMTGGGSHAGGGGGLRLSHYEGGAILAYPEGETGGTPGDAVKILLNYQDGWNTDYGHLSGDRRWYVANGWGGDMHGKAILCNVQEPGTVFQVAQQNTSRNDWANNTGVRSSPDCTKLAWTSDLWGYNAVCLAYTQQPPPPKDLKAEGVSGGVALKWTRAIATGDLGGHSPAELAGYQVYRAVKDGPFVRITRQPVVGESFTDEDPPEGVMLRYLVVSQERSGLEGTPSNEATLFEPQDKSTPVHLSLHLEAELAQLSPPARCAFDGWCSGFQYVRIRKCLETEKEGSITFTATPQMGGQYNLFARCRAAAKVGKWQVTVDGKPAGEVVVDKPAWQWLKLDKPLAMETPKATKITLASGDEDLAVDKLVLSNDPKYVPATLDDRFTAAPRKLEHLIAKNVTASSVQLAWWNPTAEPDIDYYNVYVGADEGFPTDQAHLIASTSGAEASDWGLKPGTNYVYKVTAVNRRGLVSEPAAVSVKTLGVARAVLVSLPVEKAVLDTRLTKETKNNVAYACLSDQGKEHEDDPPAEISWDFELPVSGVYTLWCRYAPADTYYTWHNVPVKLDDLMGGKGLWRMRTPYRAMSGTNYLVWKDDLWFSDKLTMYTWPRTQDEFRLSAGKHKLTISLTPKMREFPHKISELWVTNDPSWRPPGWDPQADFTKSRVRAKPAK